MNRDERTVPADEIERMRRAMAEVRAMAGPMGLRFHVLTFGCQLNENDSEKLAGLLDAMGFAEASSPEEADLVVVNTCSIREGADGRFYGHLGLLANLREKVRPDLVVAVCGCMMKQPVHVERIRKSHPFVDLVFGPSDLHRFPEMLRRRLSGSRRVLEVGEEDRIAEGMPVRRACRFRALSTVMYGCDNFCTYCIVPYVRGRERSRPLPAVLEELRGLAADGYPEVLLLGQNVNAYGKDLGGADFATLLEEAGRIRGLRRVRFMTSHPKDMSPRLIEAMAGSPNAAPHLHLPLQSGSDDVLRRMNRGYDRERFAALVEDARRRMAGLAVTTDLIVGFPGETERDFRDTLDLMDRLRFDGAFTFQFSPRPGTPAAGMEGAVDPGTMTDRFDRLVALQNAHSLASHRTVEGTVQEVLVEGSDPGGTGRATGRTPQNRLVHFAMPTGPDGRSVPPPPEGAFAAVLVTKAQTFSLEGEWKETLP